MTIQQLLNQGYKKLTKSTSPVLDSEMLLAHVIKKPKEYLLINPDKKITANQSKQFLNLLRQRAQGVPVAYLTGHKGFYNLDFIVNRNVLIPRPDTEGIIDLVAAYFNRSPQTGKKLNIIDVGTGSGCIIITLAKLFPKHGFFASDISKAALNVALKNAKRHKVKVKFKQSDLLEAWDKQPFDIIVANLPYGWKQWKNNTSADTIGLKFEPQKALFSKDDGLFLINKLLLQISEIKSRPSLIVLEFDPRQKNTIKKLAKKFMPAYETKIVMDLSKRSRFAMISKKSS
jgi:release factor glutamine methyltransferase